MRTRCRLVAALLSTAFSAPAFAATAPVTQILPATAGAITFASAAVGGGTSTQAVSLQLNVAGTVTIAAPLSANGHQEFTVGTVTGCTANGNTTNTAGSVCAFTVTFAPAYPGQRSQPLAVTLNGQVYPFGLTGMGTGPQSHLDTTNLTTVAGAAGTTSTTAYTYKTGVPLGSSAVLYTPEGVFTDSSNNIYVTDSGHDLLRVAYQTANPALACLIIMENPTAYGLTAGSNTCAGATSQPVTGDLYWLAGTTTGAYNGDNILATSANIAAAGVQVDPTGNIYLGDQANNRVRVIYVGGSSVACLIQVENPALFGLPAGSTTCTAATSQPTPGYIYTIAGTGTSGFSGDGALATSANLYTPNDTAVDPAGDVFMMNFTASATTTIGGRVRVLYNGGALAAQLITIENPTVVTPVIGNIYTVMGGLTTEAGDGGLATSAGALTIYCLRIDAYDNVYIDDKTYGSTSYGSATNVARIRVVYNGTVATPNPLATLIALENPTTVASAAAVKPGYIYTIGGEAGTATVSAPTVDGVLATAQQFAGSYGFAFDPAGDIVITDRLNYTIRRISAATGLINTIAGFPTSSTTANFISSGSAQNAATAQPTTGIGQLFGPWAIMADSAGGYYFTDYGGNRLRYLSSIPSATYPLLLPSTSVGVTSGIQSFWETNVGTPGSTLTITADSAASPFGFLSPSSVPGVSECAPNSTTAIQTSTLTTSVSLASGKSCAFGLAALPLNGGVTAGTATITDNSLNATASVHTMNAQVTAVGVTTTLAYTPTPAVAGQTETLTATLVTSTAAPVTSGTVTFYVTGTATSIGSAVLDPVAGTATITYSKLVSPTTCITTVYPGATSVNAAFTPSTANTCIPVSLTVVTLTSSNLAPNLNQSITLTGTVSSPVSAGNFSGTITITDGTTTIYSALANPTTGVITDVTSALAAGTHILKACYTGDPNYVNACSTTISVVVTAPLWTPSVTSAAGIAIVDGTSAIVNVQVATVGGYTGTVTVACGTPLPTGVGCLLNPSSFVFTGANNTLTGTVTMTTSYQTGDNRQPNSTPALPSHTLQSRGTFYAGFLIPSAALAFLLLRRRKSLRFGQALALFILCGSVLVGLSGCNSTNVIRTPKGTFNVPLIFSDGKTTTTINETVSVTGISDAN
jgi:hypothetical protein